MTSVRELELPPGWEPPRPVHASVMAALGVAFGLGFVAVGASGLTDTRADLRLFAWAFVLMGVGFTGGAATLARRGLRRTAVRGVDFTGSDDGTPVLRIRQPRALQATYALMVLSLGGGALLIGAASLTTGGGPGLLMLACGAVLVGMTLVMIARGAPEIRLDARAVQVRAGGRRLTAAWDDVEYLDGYETRHQRLLVLSARAVQRQAERLSWGTPAQRRRDAERIEIVTEHFSLDPALLFHLLRFYHEHPAARSELGTPVALQRLREARFTAP